MVQHGVHNGHLLLWMTIHMTVERETVVDTFVTLPFLLQAGNLRVSPKNPKCQNIIFSPLVSLFYGPRSQQKKELVERSACAARGCWHKRRWPLFLLFFVSVGRIFIFGPNTNTNIFGFPNFTEYEYEYIRVSKFHRIRI